jgi:hypothetical protein
MMRAKIIRDVENSNGEITAKCGTIGTIRQNISDRKPNDYIKKIGKVKAEKDEWYEKYGLIKTPVDFEFHLDENDIKDHEKIIDEVRILTIDKCNVEFGFEREKNKVLIQFGFGVVCVDMETFEEALKRYRLREKSLKEIKNGC